jgi:hypothetical protein
MKTTSPAFGGRGPTHSPHHTCPIDAEEQEQVGNGDGNGDGVGIGMGGWSLKPSGPQALIPSLSEE